jgi:hypothetical protein
MRSCGGGKTGRRESNPSFGGIPVSSLLILAFRQIFSCENYKEGFDERKPWGKKNGKKPMSGDEHRRLGLGEFHP